MKRPIRETERARKVACASRDDEKKNHRWSRVPKCYGRWDDGSASPRVCRRFAGARDAREIATRRAGSRGARAVHRVFLEAVAFHGSSADASIGGDVFSGARDRAGSEEVGTHRTTCVSMLLAGLNTRWSSALSDSTTATLER